MVTWIVEHITEIAGVAFTLIFLALEIKGKWTMWILGIVSAIFYIIINTESKLYAMAGLNLYNAAICGYGLYCWKFLKSGPKTKGLKFSNITPKLSIILSAVGIIVFGIIATVIAVFTDVPDPFQNIRTLIPFALDSLITTLSIIATWMAARKIVQSWFLWMTVNPLTIVVYVYREMAPSAILYVIYTAFSIFGYIQWKKFADNRT